ncbi:hypothetical protein LTR62_002392 [Meristemomyces frigidus]|uniref:DUF7371 domain-containing protein n=1 Tax=Meristemomyces frigidus TaxID=1508187 RepID=A0AAN7YHH9_9PEZI|nr:hypothetical protein LTR62_002392 [Meristemomyces frigidus]
MMSSLFGYSQPPAVASASILSISSTASSSAVASTTCGEHGPFTMTFDDLPNFVPSKNNTDITQAPPVPNPYHHLTFSNGYVYAPSPAEPYTPASPPHLAVFLANGSGMRTSSTRGSGSQPGEISDGPYQSMSAFWFDAFSTFVGCDNSGPSGCTIVTTGYTWSQAAGHEIAAYSQNVTVPPCPSLQGCPMQSIDFPMSFRSLSGLQMRAYVAQQERMLFVDDMALGWSNNTCAAGLTRLQHQ